MRARSTCVGCLGGRSQWRDVAALGATLDLAILDAADALAGWTGTADAWFLDGFAPARNPAMWTAGLLAEVMAGVPSDDADDDAE